MGAEGGMAQVVYSLSLFLPLSPSLPPSSLSLSLSLSLSPSLLEEWRESVMYCPPPPPSLLFFCLFHYPSLSLPSLSPSLPLFLTFPPPPLSHTAGGPGQA